MQKYTIKRNCNKKSLVLIDFYNFASLMNSSLEAKKTRIYTLKQTFVL